MRKNTSFSSGMSNYRYPAKKSTWKWTPAKIAAFTVFGLMMVALVYFESTSNRNIYNEPVEIKQQPTPLAATSDFDKEYQEFISQGKKIVPQEMLDSLKAIESQFEPNTSSSEPATSNATQPSSDIPKAQIETPVPQVKQPVVTPTERSESTESSRNQQKTTNLPSSSNAVRGPTQITGELEEAEVETPASRSLDKNIDADGNVIVEEFYTEETITGTISSMSDGTPLKGVAVSVNGTSNKVISDSQGKYSITVPGDPQFRTIRYTYMGNVTERDAAPGSKMLNVRF